MLVLYNILSQNRIPPLRLKRLYASIPAPYRKRIQKKRNHSDRLQSLSGLLLVQHGMKLLGFNSFSLADISYQKNGKPVSHYPVYFNISHSDKLVACVLSKRQPVSIDVEKNRPLTDKLEQRYLANKPESVTNIQAWVAKESVIKLLDELNMKSLPDILLTESMAQVYNQSCHIKYCRLISGYVCAVSSTEKVRYINKQQVVFGS